MRKLGWGVEVEGLKLHTVRLVTDVQTQRRNLPSQTTDRHSVRPQADRETRNSHRWLHSQATEMGPHAKSGK